MNNTTLSLKFDQPLFPLSMAVEINKDSKWVGNTSEELTNITAEQLWPLFEDFCSLHKWVPALDSEKCRHGEGVYGQPGLVRYHVFTEQASSALSNNADNKTPTKWCNEKLLSMDPLQRSLSYEVTENNLGFRSYVAEMKVIETDSGCRFDWSFISDPVEGMTLEDCRGFLVSTLKIVIEEMGKELIKQEPADLSKKIVLEVASLVEPPTDTAVHEG